MMRRTLIIDAILSAVIAGLVVVWSPGLAVVALIALATLVLVGVSLILGSVGGRWRAAARRRRAPLTLSAAQPRARPSRRRSRRGR